MMKIRFRTILVDDELPALELMRELLSIHPQVEIVGEARSVAEAAALAAALKPDLIFLDIQMPREDGFTLLPKLSYSPAIVFVTAYSEFAVRAFAVNAIDYLLKPVHPERLAATLERLQGRGANLPTGSLQMEDRIFLKTDRGLHVSPLRSITHIEAEENYSRVHLEEGKALLLRRTLSEWEKILPAEAFVRLERSLIIAPHAVRNLEVKSRDEALLFLAGRSEPLYLARRASIRLRQILGQKI